MGHVNRDTLMVLEHGKRPSQLHGLVNYYEQFGFNRVYNPFNPLPLRMESTVGHVLDVSKDKLTGTKLLFPVSHVFEL